MNPLPPALFLLLAGAALAQEQVNLPTGRILKAAPRPDGEVSAIVQRPAYDPWPYRGPLAELRLVSTMWSASGGAAVLASPDGTTLMVHLGTLLGPAGARVIAVEAGQVALVEPQQTPILDRAWCRLAIAQVRQRVEVAPAEEGAAPAYRTEVRTVVREEECAATAQALGG